MMTQNLSRRARASILCLAAAAAGTAQAELRESQVLVVYDSRILDSKLVAEYYAGSARIPLGAGGLPGLHPGVQVVDLAGLPNGGLAANPGTISYSDFAAHFRDPLRAYLSSTNQSLSIRCLLLTKGLPHRVQDINNPNPNIGDQPGAASNLFNTGNLTYASVDSELTLLWVTLNASEANGPGDSTDDGGIVNPYWRSTQPINAFTTRNIQATKNFLRPAGWGGLLWRTFPSGASGMTGGDMYLVCRIDGNTVADVIASLNRAQNLVIDTESSVMILDESGSDGVQGVSDTDSEFDNDGPTLTNNGDDYEQTRDMLLADGRFPASNIRYDQFSGAGSFLVGPRVSFGGGTVVNQNVLLLATYGANHSGLPGTAGTQYPFSFNYAPGAVFNTIESFNGRSFGGIGIGFTPQGQLADFLQAGGTFGIGNVWEPFSISVPDNAILVRNFYLGSLTWAEAAWTSIPMISWQQVVIGDPLARVRRASEDINGDQRTDLEDLYSWFAPASRPRDLNHDGRIDRADIEIVRNSVRGSESANMRPDGR